MIFCFFTEQNLFMPLTLCIHVNWLTGISYTPTLAAVFVFLIFQAYLWPLSHLQGLVWVVWLHLNYVFQLTLMVMSEICPCRRDHGFENTQWRLSRLPASPLNVSFCSLSVLQVLLQVKEKCMYDAFPAVCFAVSGCNAVVEIVP